MWYWSQPCWGFVLGVVGWRGLFIVVVLFQDCGVGLLGCIIYTLSKYLKEAEVVDRMFDCSIIGRLQADANRGTASSFMLSCETELNQSVLHMVH